MKRRKNQKRQFCSSTSELPFLSFPPFRFLAVFVVAGVAVLAVMVVPAVV
jgi:hypothetical protein